jgi:DNA-3-methyladenine glycosylase II
MTFAAQHIKAARLHLQKADPVMKRIIKQVGPFTAQTTRKRFLTLVRSILSQQISGAAAQTIQRRLIEALHPDGISPESLIQMDIEAYRKLGISRQKAGYLLDLAEKVLDGNVDLTGIHRRTDEQVVDELTQIKGIGVWTAQMFMMFSLGRMDVFPDGDLGIQRAIEQNYPNRLPLNKHVMHEISRPWRPYATVACWYLWRSLELDARRD